MDEPLASLDDARKEEILPFIARLSQRFSIPIIYVSHALEEIFALADFMVVLASGRAAASGPIEEIVGRRDLQHLIGYAESGTMLQTSVASHHEQRGLTTLWFSGGTLKVPRFNSSIGTKVRVRIKSRNVALALIAPQKTSVQNILPGTVTDIFTGEGPLVEVRLDIGCPLSARITHSALNTLDLKPGRRIYALVKGVSVSYASIE
jgi:molybdate transport system ATP-binding protein